MTIPIDAYLLYLKIPELKSAYVLAESTNHYQPLHSQVFQKGKMAGKAGLYKTNPGVNAHSDRRPNFTLCGLGSSRITGIFNPDIYHPTLGFGDVHGTNDLILVEESYTSLKVFIPKGRKAFGLDVFQLWADGDLDDEIAALVLQAVPAQSGEAGSTQGPKE